MCQEEIQGEKGVGKKGMTEQREKEIYRNMERYFKICSAKPGILQFEATLEQFRTDIFEHMAINYIYKLIKAM